MRCSNRQRKQAYSNLHNRAYRILRDITGNLVLNGPDGARASGAIRCQYNMAVPNGIMNAPAGQGYWSSVGSTKVDFSANQTSGSSVNPMSGHASKAEIRPSSISISLLISF